MMGRSRRGVKFQHKNGQTTEARRSSFSDMSEEPGSGAAGKPLDDIVEVCLPDKTSESWSHARRDQGRRYGVQWN